MKHSSIPLSLFLLLVVVSSAAADPLLMVRPVDAPAVQTLARALDASAIVRALVGEIELSNVVVHIQFARDLPAGLAGTTRFVTSRAGYRYVRITIAVTLREHDRLAILGHELQHAAEIARSDAHDVTRLRAVIDAAGFRTRANYFETDAALQIEKHVRQELRAWHPLTARSAIPAGGAHPGKECRPGKECDPDRRGELQPEPVIELHHQHLRSRRAKAATEVPKR